MIPNEQKKTNLGIPKLQEDKINYDNLQSIENNIEDFKKLSDE